MERNWKSLIGIAVVIWILSIIISSSSQIEGGNANVAVIPIKGPIGETGGIYSTGVNANDIISELNKADEMPNIKYILIDINSPGGMPVDSERIFKKIKSLDKPTIAVIEDIGTSGAYWIASGAKRIIASRVSIVGSVGVLGSYISFSGLMNKYGINYNRLVSGEYKDIGSPFRNMTPEEKKIYQERLNLMDSYFLNSVADSRNLTASEKKNISSALFYTGSQALRLHLIDSLGTYEDALNYIKNKINETPETYTFQKKKDFLSRLIDVSSKNSFLLGYGIGEAIKTEKRSSISLIS